MPKDLKEEMKKIRKKVWDKNKKKYKDFGTFGEDEFLKQDRLPGMKYGGTVMPKDKPKEKQKPKNFYEGEGYKGSPDMYPDYEEDKKDIKQGKKPQHMGMKKGGLSHGDVGGAFGKVYKGKAKDYKSVVPITPPAPKPKPDQKKYGGAMKKKPIKAALGIYAAKNLMENSQTARDVASNMGIAPRMIAEKYQKKEDQKTQGMKKGGLTGGQRKLDINKDGKISGEDFRILRGKQNKMKGGGCAIKGTKFKGVF